MQQSLAQQMTSMQEMFESKLRQMKQKNKQLVTQAIEEHLKQPFGGGCQSNEVEPADTPSFQEMSEEADNGASQYRKQLQRKDEQIRLLVTTV
jgi:uncharacterized phage infection (PIP) family protein YhgE